MGPRETCAMLLKQRADGTYTRRVKLPSKLNSRTYLRVAVPCLQHWEEVGCTPFGPIISQVSYASGQIQAMSTVGIPSQCHSDIQIHSQEFFKAGSVCSILLVSQNTNFKNVCLSENESKQMNSHCRFFLNFLLKYNIHTESPTARFKKKILREDTWKVMTSGNF